MGEVWLGKPEVTNECIEKDEGEQRKSFRSEADRLTLGTAVIRNRMSGGVRGSK